MLVSILNSETYLLALISAFIIGKIIKEQGYLLQLYSWLIQHHGNNKLILFWLSILCGVLPIEGRITVSAPLMDSIVKQDNQTRPKMGIIDYLATHHYYFWSPIEPSVVIFLTALGISWVTFLQYTWPLLVVYFMVFISILIFYVKKSDLYEPIQLSVSRTKRRQAILCGSLIILSLIVTVILEVLFKIETPLKWTFLFVASFLMIMTRTSIKTALGYVNWGIILFVAIIIAGGGYIKQYNNEIQEFIKQDHTILGLLIYGFFASFILGSSSKYAGIGSIIVLAIGQIKYLPLVLAVEYSGYMLSPTHKCLGISKLYFNTKVSHLMTILVVLSILLIAVGYWWVNWEWWFSMTFESFPYGITLPELVE